MWLKQQIEIFVVPRKINCLNYSFKGKYYFQFSIIHQSQSGTITSAYPKPFTPSKFTQKNPQNDIINLRRLKTTINTSTDQNTHEFDYLHHERERKLSLESNQADHKVSNGIGYFTTKIFSVYYQVTEIDCHDAAVFFLQSKYKEKYLQNVHKSSIDGQPYKKLPSAIYLPDNKIYLQVELFSIKNAIIQKNNGKLEFEKTVTKILEHREILNLCGHPGGLDEYHNIFISDPDHFTQIQIYIGSVHLGWKVRNKNIGITEFSQLPRSGQISITQDTCSNIISSTKQAGKLLRKLLKQGLSDQPMNFYNSTVLSAKNEYLKILKRLKNLGVAQRTEDRWIELIGSSIQNKYDLYEYYDENNLDSIFFLILRESRQLALNVERIWNIFCEKIQKMNQKTFERECTEKHQQFQEEWLAEAIVRNDAGSSKDRLSLIKCFKKKREELAKKTPIYSLLMLNHPFITLHNFSSQISLKHSKNSIKSFIKPPKIVFLAHGYQGSQHDLIKIGNYLISQNPDIQLVFLKSLSHNASMNLQQMGESVANEVKNQLMMYCQFQSISFIGYSMGGLVIRAALKHLVPFKDKMHLFITLSTPHLGIFNSSNKLIHLGAWYITSIEKDKAIQELYSEIEQGSSSKTILKRLSEQNFIGWFSKIVLVTSLQDQFVPYYSASISTNIKYKQAKLYAENIRKNVRKIEQVQVWFDAQKRASTLDKLTGRQSHIQFLDNQGFLYTFFYLYAKQF